MERLYIDPVGVIVLKYPLPLGRDATDPNRGFANVAHIPLHNPQPDFEATTLKARHDRICRNRS